jgi:type I restriction enzyme, R subunit
MPSESQWVRLHPYNIAAKVQIVVEHYRENVQPLLDGKAKAMVVVASRREAVRWQKAIREYIERRGYPLGVLVAFSGEVDDPQSYPGPVTESSKLLNPGLKNRDIREAFAQPEFHLLLVANKFQTGFDQPLLCGMYVDKKLGGIQAVETLSRLNRAHPGKATTYVLDFVNDAGDVLKAFKTYYETAELAATTDPNLIFDLRSKLDAAGHYDDLEVERLAKVEMDPRATQAQLVAAIHPVADRLLKRYKALQQARAAATEADDGTAEKAAKDELDALVLFKGDMASFNRLYAFLSQMFDYGNTDIEKRFLFYMRLLPLLEFGRERDTVDLSKVVLTHHTLRSGGKQPINLDADGSYKLPPLDGIGSGQVQDKQQAYLVEIIEKVNGLFEGQLTDDDQLVYVNGVLKGKLLENQTLIQQAAGIQQRAVRQLARPQAGADGRDHGCVGSAHQHEQSGAGLGAGARWIEGYLDGAGAAVRGPSCTGGGRTCQWLTLPQSPGPNVGRFGVVIGGGRGQLPTRSSHSSKRINVRQLTGSGGAFVWHGVHAVAKFFDER